MILFDEDRPSDSPFVERVWRCHSEGANPFLSIAASRCELVVSRLQGKITVTMRGPETRATALGDCPGDGERFGILLKLGTFLPHLPTGTLVDAEVNLPVVAKNSFWLFDSAWQLPDYDNADTFVDRLMRKGLLDTYTSERHPIGAWVLDWTRAQVAVMRGDAYSRALRGVVTDLLGTRDGATYYVKRISGLWQRYDLGNGHPLVGATMPNLRLDDGTRLSDHTHEGRSLLVDLAGDDRLAALAKPYAGRLELVRGVQTAPG